MKKFLIIVTMMMLCVGVSWAYDVKIDGIYYNLDNNNKTAEVTYSNDDNYTGFISIPEYIAYNKKVYTITSIGESAFSSCSGLTSVSMPNSVISIGYKAFYDCSALTSITIPNSVTSIDESAFSGCSALTSITIPNSVTSIGGGAFENCSGLTSVVWNAKNCKDFSYTEYSATSPFYKIRTQITSFTIGNEVEHIPAYLCFRMTKLKEVTIPNSVTSIGSRVFSGCDLTSITIPNSVTSIGDGAFSGCDLTSVMWNAKNCNDFNDYSDAPFYSSSDLLITSFIFGDEVEHIPAYLCYGMTELKEVSIPNSVTSIGYKAFYDCFGLTSVVWNAKNCNDFDYSDAPFYSYRGLPITSFIFGDEVEHIPAHLYYGMTKLKEVTIPNSVTSIGAYAITGCSVVDYLGTVDEWVEIDFESSLFSGDFRLYINNELLTDVKITSADSIKQNAFSDCRIYSVEVGNSVTYIGESAFRNSGLITISIDNSVTSIGEYAFSDCDDLTSITIPNSVTSIGAYAFKNCSGLTSVTIGNSVTSIGGGAFENCSGLTSVSIGNSVTSIAYDTFSDCTGLTSVTIPNSVTSIASSAFDGCSALTSIVWNAKNFRDISEYDTPPFDYIRSQITSFTFGEDVEHIPAYLCFGMTKLKEVTIANGVTSIGDNAFLGCFGLTSVVWNAKNCKDFTDADGFSNSPFYYLNSQITSFTIGNDVVHIPAGLCSGMSKLKEITIPYSVTSIGEDVFYNCSALTSVVWNAKNCNDFSYVDGSLSPFYKISSPITSLTIGNEVEHIPACLCLRMTKLKEVSIANSVTSIGDAAFSGCSGLTSITIPNSVTSIGDVVLAGCSGLTSITIPNSVTSIGRSAFDWCSGLTSITIPNSVTSIGDHAFSNCTGLTSVTIGNSVTSIGGSAFNNCSALTAITIPNSVTSIGFEAFYHCSGLTSVTIGNSVSSIGEYAFNACDNLRKVVAYPKEIPTVYTNSFGHYDAALYVLCDVYDDYFFHDVLGAFKVIDCITADEVEFPDKVEIEVNKNNNAIITWPSKNAANSYELVVSKDGDVFCKYLFNANGQLCSIDFSTRAAEIGFQFTITGLDVASKYDYVLSALDWFGEILESYSGVFTTNAYEGSHEDSEKPEEGGDGTVTSLDENLVDANIIIAEGSITSQDSDFSIYNTVGQDVTALNGSLLPGIYVVVLGDDKVKVMMK